MKEKMVPIWDGVEIREVPESEAKELERADKAQIMNSAISGADYKTRDEFQGYKTRELRADNPKKRSVRKRAKKSES